MAINSNPSKGECEAARIALLARLFRLLADRPEFLASDVGQRIDAAWTGDAPGSLSVLDRWLVTRATELDQLCGYAVAKMRAACTVSVLDVLGMLDAERIVAMYCALPETRRGAVLRDGTWAYRVAHSDLDAVAEAVRDWDDMPDLQVPCDMSAEAQAEIQNFTREAQRYRAGLAHELTPAQVEMVDRGGRRTRELLATATRGTT